MKTKYAWLDWLRFGAAFLVVLAHTRHLVFVKYSELTETNPIIAIAYTFTRMGNEAVIIFFVISGFLVGGKAIERMRFGKFNLRSYVIDRITRIMIPLVPAILLTIAVDFIIGGNINYLYALGNLFSLQGILVPQLPQNEALWTLSYEVWFYIGIAAIALSINRNILLPLICALVFMKLEVVYLICWLIGVAAYQYRTKKHIGLLIVSIVICLYGYIGRQVGRGSESIDIAFLSYFLPSENLSRVIFAIGIGLFIQQIILMRSNKIERLGSKLAAFSYSLYLTHFPIIKLFRLEKFSQVNIQSISVYISVITCCLLAAYSMYFFFESKTDNVRKVLKNANIKGNACSLSQKLA